MTPITLRTSSTRRTIQTLLADLRVYWGLAALVALLVSITFSSTLRSEVSWGGDEALYILHARNLAEGHPYADTGYIFNPRNPIHPAASPPGLPLLLAPIYRLRGADLADFKIQGVDFYCLFLLVFAAFAKNWVPRGLALAAVAILGVHPYAWELKETIPSEFPFMVFCYGALVLFDRCPTDDSRRSWLFLGGAALLAASACLTRPIGIVLFPAMALIALYRERRWSAPGMVAVAAGAAITLLVQRLFRPDVGTYVNYFDAFNAHTLSKNIDSYAIAYRYFLEDHHYFRKLSGHALATLLSATAIIGFIQRARTRASVFEVFTLGYVGLLLIYPISLEPDRYSFPLWPLILLYALVGCNLLGSLLMRNVQYLPATLLCVVLIANFIFTYRALEHETTQASMSLSGLSHDLFRAVRTESPQGAVLIARKPTVLVLYTGRRSAVWPANCTAEEFVAYARSIGAEYLVQEVGPRAGGSSELVQLDEFIAQNPTRLTVVYSNPAFKLFKLSDAPAG